jgi:hypothetical protein
MYTLSEEEIDFVSADIRARGIGLNSLHENILDHVCCLLEEEMQVGQDFHAHYETVISRFYREALWEIEEETYLLITFKNFRTMKKVTTVSGIFSAIFLNLGILFKYMHWPGASAFIQLGIISMAFVFLPLLLIMRNRDTTSTREKIVNSLGFVLAITLALHVLFKVMHWPGATLFIMATGVLLAGFIPLFFFNGYKNENTRPNTIVVTLLILSATGLFFTLTRTPQSSRLKMQTATQVYLQSELILQREKAITEKSVATGYGKPLSKQITELCENLKRDIIKFETGKSISELQSQQSSLVIEPTIMRDVLNQSLELDRETERLFAALEQYKKNGAESSINFYETQTLRDLVNMENSLIFLQVLNQIEMQMLQEQKQVLANNN